MPLFICDRCKCVDNTATWDFCFRPGGARPSPSALNAGPASGTTGS